MRSVSPKTSLWLDVVLVVGLGLLAPSVCWGQDVRLALLMANEKGWNKDPKLRYVLRGDLRPLARTMRRLGFQVKVIENGSAARIRRVWKWIQRRMRRAPKVSTFVFYYSGHADAQHFHTGPRGKQPLTYKEFVSFFNSLNIPRRIALFDSCYSGEVIRKFGSLQRFRRLLRTGQTKGFKRSKRKLNLQRLLRQSSRGDERGLRIIASSLDVSWELRKYRSSVFTHHLLQGLRGAADSDNDGKVTVNELYNYARIRVYKDTGQQLKQLVSSQHTTPYALAPAYRSRLVIGPETKGKIKISVANFYWSFHKQKSHAVRLATVHGKGLIELQRGKRCYRQEVMLPKGRDTRLNPQGWQPIRCRQLVSLSKGSIAMEAQRYVPPPKPKIWALELQGGTQITQVAGSSALAGLALGIRHRFFGVHAGVWGASTQFVEPSTQLLFSTWAELGYRLDWPSVHLFLGGMVGLNLLIQDIPQASASVPFVRYGATADVAVQLPQRWALLLAVQGGGTSGVLGGQWTHLPLLTLHLGVRYFL
ncbi:MAG: caspase family protein [Deltaproteobacteria bacterium]|nr:MAG: caspase family protein [Deltaproteobacteria bacterium]